MLRCNNHATDFWRWAVVAGRVRAVMTSAAFPTVAAILIFIATYLVVALGKLPGLHLDRAGAALLGGALMVAVGVLTPEEAYKAVDVDTIVLLLGMMIVVAYLRLSGFFRLAQGWVARGADRPLTLLAGIVVMSAFLSAFLVNDTICLVMTPFVADLALRLKRDPVPYLLAVAMASNVGSVATITGNPQNMIIGTVSGLSYGGFAAALTPVALVGAALTILLIAAAYRREFLTAGRLALAPEPLRYHRPLVTKALVVLGAMVALFFAGLPIAKVAITGGALLLVTRRVKPAKVYREIDWPLLVMFCGLFITVAGLEKVLVTPELVDRVAALQLDRPGILSLVTAVLSNVVSNVPAVLVMKPFVAATADPDRAWTVVAMASTLAGNFTLLGSVANLIVAERAKAFGVEVRFMPYFVVGAPLTILTILFGVWWL